MERSGVFGKIVGNRILRMPSEHAAAFYPKPCKSFKLTQSWFRVRSCPCGVFIYGANMKLIYTVIKIIILLLFLLLAVINMDAVTFSYLPGQSANLPLIVVLFGAFVVGIVFGMFALFGRLLSLRGENSRLRAEVKKSARLSGQKLTAPPIQNAAESAKQP
ncbi:conserved hypothetical protein [Neisseria gonorrhoeae 1291]|nr:conserved hypothetical protein [Neisseria gonorrhoeae 1291]EEZ48657.1 hypothetical protein NGFG_02113 [Neisseria gonorrhoeae MS11]